MITIPIRLLLIITLITAPIFSFSLTSEELFGKIKTSYQNSFPDDFVANVSGEEIENSLKKIPKDAQCRGKSPKVSYLFIKNKVDAESIIVENVENPYVTRFQAHLDIYKSAKSFLDRRKDSFAVLKKTYEWTYIPKQSDKNYVVKMRKHRQRKTNYILLHIDKNSYNILKAVQYSNNKAIGTLWISYRKVKGYSLPSQLKFDIYKKQRGKLVRKKFTLNISNYKLNVGLTNNKIIQLQDDCPSVSKVIN